jgi:hypothetical protein
MELVLKLKDESKLEALLNLLRRFTTAEGVDLTVERVSEKFSRITYTGKMKCPAGCRALRRA